jgi:hypothetical protein
MPVPISNEDKLVDWLITLDLNILLPSLISLASIIIGIFINEYFKRKNRESLYSEAIFSKKLEIYESLNEKMHNASELATEITENKELTKEKREQIWDEKAIDILTFMDKNDLYLNEDIAVHCMITLTGLKGIQNLNEEDQKEQMNRFYEGINTAKNLIREDTGLKRLNDFLNKVNRPSLKSGYIKAYKEIKKVYDKDK